MKIDKVGMPCNTQDGYSVRFDWGAGGVARLGPEVRVIVIVDVLRQPSPRSHLGETHGTESNSASDDRCSWQRVAAMDSQVQYPCCNTHRAEDKVRQSCAPPTQHWL